MNKFRLITLGFLATFLSSWIGLVLMPIITVGELQVARDPKTGEEILPHRTALEERGKEVYISMGCIYCHTQQVNPIRARTDIERGWGTRRTIAADYVNEGRVLLGTMRGGPDLSTVGIRNPSESWHLLHLYNPRTTSPGSNMPPHRFLFEKRKIDGEKSPEALSLVGEFAVEEGYEVVPGPDAKALVAYLRSLKIGSYPVPGHERALIESVIETPKPKNK
ncbi:cbb3-type cytochrome c oxidase subunit II (plasmid) [Verrucomicrobiaceae bacterium 227]